MNAITSLRLERREAPKALEQAVSLGVTLLAAVAIVALMIRFAGKSVPEAFTAFWLGSFGGWQALIETMVKATPLMLAGLSSVVAFRAKIWNIGGEGQLFAGGIAAYWVTVTFARLPAAGLIPLILVAGMAGGALWGVLPGILKAHFKVDEIIVTVLMNYIMVYLISFLLNGPWRDPRGFFAQTASIPDVSHLPLLLANSRLHIGFAAALIAAALAYVFLWKTPLGYEIRAFGGNRTAARFQGVKVERLIVLVMAISGALAGLAGAGELNGLLYRLRPDLSSGYGYTGIIIALLGRLTPAGAIIAAIFFGALVNGATQVQILTGVPVALVYAIQGVVLLFLLCSDALSRYRIRS